MVNDFTSTAIMHYDVCVVAEREDFVESSINHLLRSFEYECAYICVCKRASLSWYYVSVSVCTQCTVHSTRH